MGEIFLHQDAPSKLPTQLHGPWHWCQGSWVEAPVGGNFSGRGLLRAGIEFCEAIGFKLQWLQDESSWTEDRTPGRLLAIYHRGWTWYMRNGFVPFYRDIAPESRINLHGTEAEVRQDLAPHLARWCEGEVEAQAAG